MASFDYMTQPTSVTIPISIFGQADAAGIQAGNSQKTTLQAIADGVTGAIKGYTDTTAALQQNEIRANQISQQPITNAMAQEQLTQAQQNTAIKANQISQLPVSNAYDQEQLEAIQTRNEIAEKQLEFEKKNEALIEQAKLAELNSKVSELDVATQDAAGRKRIADTLATGNADQLRNLLNEPVLLKDSKLLESVAGLLSARGILSQEEQAKVYKQVDFTAEREAKARKEEVEAQLAKKKYTDIDKVSKNLTQGMTGYVNSKYGFKDGDWGDANKVMIYPSGLKQADPNTDKVDINAPDNANSLSGTAGKFDIFVNTADGWIKQPIVLSDSEADNVSIMQSYFQSFDPTKKRSGPTPLVASNATPTPAADIFKKTVNSAPFQGTPFPSPTPGMTSSPSPVASPGNTVTPIPDTPQVYSPTPVVPPTVAPSSGMQAPNASEVIMNSTDSVTRRQAEILQKRSEADPVLANRLYAKGKLNQMTQPTQKPEATATVPAEENKSAPNAGEAFLERNMLDQNVSPTVAPESLRQTIALKHKTIAKDLQKAVSVDTVMKVINEPLLSELPSLFKAVAATESGGNRNAKSPTGPVGLFQLSEAAASDTKVNRNLPEQNVKGGVKYLSMMLKRFDNDTVKALMAYNVGASVIDDAVDKFGAYDHKSIVTALNLMKNRGMYKKLLTSAKIQEVSDYPRRVLAYKELFDSMPTYV